MVKLVKKHVLRNHKAWRLLMYFLIYIAQNKNFI